MPHHDFQIQTYSPRIRVAGFYCKNGKILFVKHRKGNKEYYLLPGGGQKFGETFIETLEREIKEELSVACTVKNFVHIGENVRSDKKKHRIQIVFSMDLNPDDLQLGEDPAVHGFQFLTPEEVLTFDTRPYPMDFLHNLVNHENKKFSPYKIFPWIME